MWVSSEIHYKRTKVYKRTPFGKKKKNGYELTKPLRYKFKEGVFFVLPTGYVWDGPSYMGWLEWLVGDRDKGGSLATSAFHDTHRRIPTRYIATDESGDKEIAYTYYSIKDGAKLYKKMLDEWPNRKDTVKPWQSKIQKYGLLLIQPLYSLMNLDGGWKKV